MKSDSIVDSRLWVRHKLGADLEANSFFKKNPAYSAHFVSQFILYDKLIIPTKDFGIIPSLIYWIGLPIFQEALENDTIGFVRPKYLLGYAGNGTGITGSKIVETTKSPFTWFDKALYGHLEEAPDLQLKHRCTFLKSLERGMIGVKP